MQNIKLTFSPSFFLLLSPERNAKIELCESTEQLTGEEGAIPADPGRPSFSSPPFLLPFFSGCTPFSGLLPAQPTQASPFGPNETQTQGHFIDENWKLFKIFLTILIEWI